MSDEVEAGMDGVGRADRVGRLPAFGPGDLPDEAGRFSTGSGERFGGRYVPETLMPALEELTGAYASARSDPAFADELYSYLAQYAGRPTPLYEATRLGRHYGGRLRIFLKREDLNHTGAHKLNNTLGQVLLARRMGKGRIIAETGAGQHGVATATSTAMFGLECEIYMGAEDMARQALNVYRMELLGATVREVTSGTRTLKDATNEAIRDWVTHVESTYYIIGSVVGPHPYPRMVRDFQAVLGDEARRQIVAATGRLPDVLVACVGGGSNAMGLFYPFLKDPVAMIGVEAAGEGLETGAHAAPLTAGEPGVLHGALSYLLQDADGQIAPAHSISAGLDYPGVGPEHAWLRQTGRARYTAVSDDEAVAAFERLSRLEGIVPALESAHALAYLERLAEEAGEAGEGGGARPLDVVVCLSGRGDKDVESMARRRAGRPQGGEGP